MMRIEENFLKTYDKYASSIFRHIFFRVSDKNLAEDLTQETFFKAWRHVVGNKKREIENFKAFFYKIANNLIIDYYRRKSRMPANIDDIPEKELEYLLKIRFANYIVQNNHRRVASRIMFKRFLM